MIRGLEFLPSRPVCSSSACSWAAWWVPERGGQHRGYALLIWFWVGLQLVSFLFGDVWRLFNPYVTIADSGVGSSQDPG